AIGFESLRFLSDDPFQPRLSRDWKLTRDREGIWYESVVPTLHQAITQSGIQPGGALCRVALCGAACGSSSGAGGRGREDGSDAAGQARRFISTSARAG